MRSDPLCADGGRFGRCLSKESATVSKEVTATSAATGVADFATGAANFATGYGGGATGDVCAGAPLVTATDTAGKSPPSGSTGDSADS